ncbi:MAG: acyl carrier protein [Planctomycetota bacterium]|jgi:acyl carrier protein
MDDLERRMRAVISRVLEVDEGAIKESDRFVEDLEASSIQSIELVAGFEEEFDIEMIEDEALGVKSVGDAVKYVRAVVEKGGD